MLHCEVDHFTETVTLFSVQISLQVRALREEMPSNMATLCYKAVERIVSAAHNMCNSHHEQQTGDILKFCSFVFVLVARVAPCVCYKDMIFVFKPVYNHIME